MTLRAGLFMHSQCATERTNKIPKEVWTHDRISISSKSMARGVFVNTNLDRFATLTFNLGAVKLTGHKMDSAESEKSDHKNIAVSAKRKKGQKRYG